MLIYSVLVKVVGGTEDKEDHGFLETHLVVHRLQGWELWLKEELKFPAADHDKSVSRKPPTSMARKGF